VSNRLTVVSSHGLARASARNARTQRTGRTDGTSTKRAGRHALTEGR
jgi:hypothetical protein